MSEFVQLLPVGEDKQGPVTQKDAHPGSPAQEQKVSGGRISAIQKLKEKIISMCRLKTEPVYLMKIRDSGATKRPFSISRIFGRGAGFSPGDDVSKVIGLIFKRGR